MNEFKTIDDLLDFAIKEEEDAAAFYLEWSRKMETDWMRKIFEEFASEEARHKAKLLQIRKGGRMEPSREKVMDLKLSDYLVDAEKDGVNDYESALVFAMKKEKAAFRMYSDMAAAVEDDELKRTLLALAQEEAKHKLRFEVEYDECVYQEN